MTIKIQHFQPYNVYSHHAKYTVVSRLIYKEDEQFPSGFEFAVSFCSPKDQFNKKSGRIIAYSRLQNKDKEYYRHFDLTAKHNPKYLDLRDLIVSTIFATMNIPRWLRDSY